MKRFLALILCAMLLAGVCTLAAAEELPTVNIVVSMNTSTDDLNENEFLKNLAADNAASGAQNVEAVPGASASGSPESLPDANGNVPKTQAERMAAAEAVVAELLDDDKK